MVMLKSFAFIAVIFVAGIAQGLEVGQIPPSLTLEGKAGGRVDGSPWSSSELMGKVHSVFYVDPDKKKVNAHVEKALKKRGISKGQVSFYCYYQHESYMDAEFHSWRYPEKEAGRVHHNYLC